MKIAGSTTTLETQQSNADLALRVRTGSSFLNAVYIDADVSRVGIFKAQPTATLDVNGDVTVQGSLLVKGDSTFINASTLTVEDKNIELGLLNDSTEGNDAAVDDGGIILRSSQGSKDFTWSNSTKSWTSNQDLDLRSTPENPVANLKFDGTDVLSKTELGATVILLSLIHI